jgi:hypothetical protein
MRKIIITVEITDPEDVADYWDVADKLIEEDLQFGSLMEVCELVSVERVENG